MIKRIVPTHFWKHFLVMDQFTVLDKYFALYLMTNPHSKELGIYLLPKRYIAFQMGVVLEQVDQLIKRFTEIYRWITYDTTTQEIALLHSLQTSIIRGADPSSIFSQKKLRRSNKLP